MPSRSRLAPGELNSYSSLLERLNEEDKLWLTSRLCEGRSQDEGIRADTASPSPPQPEFDRDRRALAGPAPRRPQSHDSRLGAEAGVVIPATLALLTGLVVGIVGVLALLPTEKPEAAVSRQIQADTPRALATLDIAPRDGTGGEASLAVRRQSFAADAAPASDTAREDAGDHRAQLPRQEQPVLRVADRIVAEVGEAVRLGLRLTGRNELPAEARLLIRGVPEHVAVFPAIPLGGGAWRVAMAAVDDLQLLRYAISAKDAPIEVHVQGRNGEVLAVAATRLVSPPVVQQAEPYAVSGTTGSDTKPLQEQGAVVAPLAVPRPAAGVGRTSMQRAPQIDPRAAKTTRKHSTRPSGVRTSGAVMAKDMSQPVARRAMRSVAPSGQTTKNVSAAPPAWASQRGRTALGMPRGS